MRLAILTSHPIQYQAPWFRALAREVDLQVFFAHQPAAAEQGAGFGRAFTWDVDLLSGYPHQFLKNVASRPGMNRYDGCDTPEIAGMIQGDLRSRLDAFIVTGWYLKSYRQAIRACRRAGVPVLVRGDSQLGTPRSFLRKLAMELRQRWLLRQFDGFLSVGQRHSEYLRHFGVPGKKIFFAPHFVDNKWFAAKAADVRGQRSVVRAHWGIAEDAFVPLFVGKFQPKKRPMDLMRAAGLLLSHDSSTPNPQSLILDPSPSPLHLLFVGSGELGEQLRESCHVAFDADNCVSVSGSQNVSISPAQPPTSAPSAPTSDLRPLTSGSKPSASFAGFKNQSELPAIYAAADVLVLPSDGGETWGLVVNEAMACGLPAIVSDAAGCAPDLIEEGRTGFTFPLGDVEALAKRLKRVQEMNEQGHGWDSALAAKLAEYSVSRAVAGTLQGANVWRQNHD